MLSMTMNILGVKGFNEEMKFAEQFCANAYFRIPQFRQRLLGLIDRPNDPHISEWRGTDFSLNDKSQDFKTYLPGENTFELLFDWESYFYDHLKNESAYDNNL